MGYSQITLITKNLCILGSIHRANANEMKIVIPNSYPHQPWRRRASVPTSSSSWPCTHLTGCPAPLLLAPDVSKCVSLSFGDPDLGRGPSLGLQRKGQRVSSHLDMHHLNTCGKLYKCGADLSRETILSYATCLRQKCKSGKVHAGVILHLGFLERIQKKN